MLTKVNDRYSSKNMFSIILSTLIAFVTISHVLMAPITVESNTSALFIKTALNPLTVVIHTYRNES